MFERRQYISWVICITLSTFLQPSVAQTLGGSAVFNFLKLPATPQLSALGSINTSNITNDIGLAFHNPAALRPQMHLQTSFSFNSMYAGIKNFAAQGAYHQERLATSFAFGLHYLNYGTVSQTDAAGNELGVFKPSDFVVQATASRKYLERWYYGATLKFIQSNYGQYSSNGIAIDIGASYYDSSRAFQASLVMKNMGMQLKKYEGTNGDDLPFDLQFGLTKKLKMAPIQFSLTLHHLHGFNTKYNDTSFNNDTDGDQAAEDRSFTAEKVFRHVVFATQVFITDKVEITIAYNYLRRKELNINGTANGLGGFSMGAGVLFKKLSIRYARSFYQSNTAYNQFGLNILFGNTTGW